MAEILFAKHGSLVACALVPALLLASGGPSGEELSAAVAADIQTPVRPGGDGRPFWNCRSVQFILPPAFGFAAVKGAVKYRFTVTDDVLRDHVFEAEKPTSDLAPVWRNVPVGFVRVSVEGVDAAGRDCGHSGTRRFWKAAAFEPGLAPEAPWSYAEGARRHLENLFAQPNTVSFREKGRPDGVTPLMNVYPSKMNSALIRCMLMYAKLRPDRRDEAIRTAQNVADYMLSVSEPADAPLAFFPPTYKRCPEIKDFASAADKYEGQVMLIYPAWMAGAYLELYQVLRDRKYLDAALGIAATYERLQLPEGTWFVKMHMKDGTPVVEGNGSEPVRIIPTDICQFFDQLADVTGERRWRAIADRCVGFFDSHPLRTWDWAAQFEDVEPSARYRNLSEDMACDVALILLDRSAGDPKRVEQAREILRWAEDQFVFWRRPCRADLKGMLSEEENGFKPVWDFNEWIDVPSAAEQYMWYIAINSKTAKLMRLFLRLYQVERKPLDLAKARALGNGILTVQKMHGTGEIPTHFRKSCIGDLKCIHNWTNCGMFTVIGLNELSEEVEK